MQIPAAASDDEQRHGKALPRSRRLAPILSASDQTAPDPYTASATGAYEKMRAIA